jgi:hypothetical protein
MTFSAPLSVTLDMMVPEIEPNLEDIQMMDSFSCPQCIIHLVNFLIFILIFSVFIVLSLIEIFIGIFYVNECSMNHYIPIYLIVAGFISILNLIFAIFGVKYSPTSLYHFSMFL